MPRTGPSLKNVALYTRLQIVAVLVPCIAFYGILLRFYTRVPLIDDYWHLIAFALQWHSTAGALARMGLLFHTQVGPYKLIFDHSLVALQLAMLGKLNFPLMILLGNLTVLGIFAILCRNTPRRASHYGWLALLPISLLLFSLNYAETVDWAVSGLQQPAVILFSLLSLHFLVRLHDSKAAFALAVLCALLASATYANGILVFPVGAIYLLQTTPRSSRLGWQSLTWLSSFGVCLFEYLYHSKGSGLTAKASLLAQARFFVAFCGGGLENMHHRPVPGISYVLGLPLLAVLVHSAFTRYDRRNAYFFYSMVWIVITAVVVANARTGMGLQLSLSSRYKIYCDLLLVYGYVYGLDRVAQRSFTGRTNRFSRLYLPVAVAASMLFCVGSDLAGAAFLRTRQTRADTAMRAYLADPASGSPMFLVEDVLSPGELAQEDLARQELTDAARTGIYKLPVPDHLGLF